MSVQFSAVDFARKVLAEFPELADDFRDNADLLHLQVADFARLAERAVASRDWERFSRCVTIADELWRNPDDALLNALNVSFLENLAFAGLKGRKAWKLMTPALRKGWKDMQSYLDDLAESARRLDASQSDTEG